MNPEIRESRFLGLIGRANTVIFTNINGWDSA